MGVKFVNAVLESNIGRSEERRIGQRGPAPKRDAELRLRFFALYVASRAHERDPRKMPDPTPEGAFNPRVETMVLDTGLPRSQVSSFLKLLRDAGVLVERQAARGWKTAFYIFEPAGLRKWAPSSHLNSEMPIRQPSRNGEGGHLDMEGPDISI
jgi:hypothetical protein